jgi:hypothetical protein
MKHLQWIELLSVLLFILGCDKDCICSGTLESNFRLTANGSRALPDSLEYIRESEAYPNRSDTLKVGPNSTCIPGIPGKNRVLVYSGDGAIWGISWMASPGQVLQYLF